PVGLAESRSECIADFVGGEVLILDIDRLARGRDRVEILGFNFPHTAGVVDCRFSARDADRNVAQRLGDRGRPDRAGWMRTSAAEYTPLRPRQIELLVRGALPAVAQQIAERARSGAFDR